MWPEEIECLGGQRYRRDCQCPAYLCPREERKQLIRPPPHHHAAGADECQPVPKISSGLCKLGRATGGLLSDCRCQATWLCRFQFSVVSFRIFGDNSTASA